MRGNDTVVVSHGMFSAQLARGTSESQPRAGVLSASVEIHQRKQVPPQAIITRQHGIGSGQTKGSIEQITTHLKRTS